jgi:hypothetical protein
VAGLLRSGERKDRYNQQTRTQAGDLAQGSWFHQRPCSQAGFAPWNMAKGSQASKARMKMAQSIAADVSQKRIGAYNVTVLYEGLQGISLRPFTKILGWTPDELELLLVDVRKDLRNPKMHAMFD